MTNMISYQGLVRTFPSYYWSKSTTAGAATVYSLADFNNRSVSTANDDERFAVTCVARGAIGSVTVEKNNAYRLPYDLKDGAVVRVRVVDNQGSPIAGIKVVSVVDKYTLSNAINNGVTDSNGDVRFNISSILARDATPLRFTVGLSSVSNNQVRFLDLPRYVRTGEWRNSIEKPYATLCFYDTIELMARGDCTKASVKRNELWWGASYDSYFVDSFYVYRIQSENLFRTRSFSGAADPLVMPASEKYGVYTLTRPDPYRSFNPVLYDLKYYWVVNEAKKRVEAYDKIDDMSRQVNMKMSFNMVAVLTSPLFMIRYQDCIGELLEYGPITLINLGPIRR
ncbi:Ig-like domain-containing protein [Aeromonas hydrophila]